MTEPSHCLQWMETVLVIKRSLDIEANFDFDSFCCLEINRQYNSIKLRIIYIQGYLDVNWVNSKDELTQNRTSNEVQRIFK